MHGALVGVVVGGIVAIVGILVLIPYRIAKKKKLSENHVIAIKAGLFSMFIPFFLGVFLVDIEQTAKITLVSFGCPILIWIFCLFIALKGK